MKTQIFTHNGWIGIKSDIDPEFIKVASTEK
jgi:hypothetical protein